MTGGAPRQQKARFWAGLCALNEKLPGLYSNGGLPNAEMIFEDYIEGSPQGAWRVTLSTDLQGKCLETVGCCVYAPSVPQGDPGSINDNLDLLRNFFWLPHRYIPPF